MLRRSARTRSQPVPPLENIKAPPPNAKAVPPPKRGRLPRKSTAAADNSERALVLRRLVDALHDGDFDNDLDPSQEEEEDSDTEYAPDAENDTEKHTDESLENKEKKLILRIKMANIRERRATDTNASGSQPMRVEDVDWPEFDAETINDILRRRQELRSQQGSKENMARLKKSSLAPPPLQLEKAKSRQFVRAGSEEGEEVEGMDVDDADVPASAGQDHKNDEAEAEAEAEEQGSAGDEHEQDEEEEEEALGELFDDVTVAAGSLAQGSLHLPLRAMESAEETTSPSTEPQQLVAVHQPQPERHPITSPERPGPPRDMRLELQNELRREEQVLKDLRAEIIDKLFKLQTEEKLLRMIVRHDFDIPEDEPLPADEPPALPESVQRELDGEPLHPDYAAIAAAAAAAMEVVNQSALGQHDDADSDDASSLSGMSSSSSEDEIQDDEVTRGALSRVLDQYLPDNEWPNNSE